MVISAHQRPVAVARALLADPAPSRQATRRHGLAADGIDKSRDGYVRLVTPIARRTFLALILVGGFGWRPAASASLVPSGFLPDEDQGAFMAEIAAPRRRSRPAVRSTLWPRSRA
jgi:HAE1 family hydrophobic/amphiphilic exporter-1